MKKLLFIFNPHSGTGGICKHLGIVGTLDGENGGEYAHIDISTEKQVLHIALPEGR